MANKYIANPTTVVNSTQTAETTNSQEIQDYSVFLPNVNRSESLTRFFGATVNQLLSSGSTQSIDAYWGRLSGKNYNPESELFNPEMDATRLNYQFQPGITSKVGTDTHQTVSYINWLKRLESLGTDLTNHDRLFSEDGYVLDLPVNADMMINYSNYYWLEGDIPLVQIEATVADPIDIDSIVAQSTYTTPILENHKSIEFVSGIRVQFIGSNITSTSGDYFADYTYYVENVGRQGGIKLVPITDNNGVNLFPTVTPYSIAIPEGWDTVDWDSTPWSGTADFEEYDIATNATRDDLNLNKSYIVMERWATDMNPWARSNKWFSLYALQAATEFNELDIEAYQNVRTRADRPIIEFNANMELFNTCSNYVETVDYVISLSQVTVLLSGVSEFFIDDEHALQDGDIVLVAKEDENGIEITDPLSGSYSPSFSSAFNLGVQTTFYENSYIVSGTGGTMTLIPHNTYNDDEFVVIDKGVFKGQVYGFKDDEWGISQVKNTRGQAPLFNLYNQEQTLLTDFDDNDFSGDKIFGYKTNGASGYDRELDIHPIYTNQGTFNDYQFEWTLSNQRYNQNIINDTSEEIRGYYFWKDRENNKFYNGWSNIDQRVPVIQTKIADGVNQPVFELGTDKVSRSQEYSVTFENDEYRWYEHSYIARTPIGSPNPSFVWKYDTDYTINTVISNSSNSLEFVDPFGNSTNIATTIINDVLTTVNVNSSYEYNKIIYRNQNDATVFGEIFLSNYNHNRYIVQHNGQYLIEDEDYTFAGTTLTITKTLFENDVIELSYVADVDLENVVYDVAPVHFYNSDNNPFTEIGYDDLISHLGEQMNNMPGFNGKVSGTNNYYNIYRPHSYGGKIRQQIFGTKKIQYLMDQETINPVRALKTFASDYTSFKTYFKNKVYQLWTTESWTSVKDLVDRAINDINIGKSDDFKYAHSDMAYTKQPRTNVAAITDATTTFALPAVINKYGDSQNHVQVWLKEYDGVSSYVERPLVKGIDYNIVDDNVELANAVNLNGSSDPATLTIRWYDYQQLSHIPFSSVKLGFFRPTQVEILDGILIGHDGARHEASGTEFNDMNSSSFDVVTSALYDFELRVFNNLVDKHSIQDDMYNYDMGELFPNPTDEFAYSLADLNIHLDDWFNRWAVNNNITDLNTVAYDAGDEFTWNYKSVSPFIGSWRALYVYMFGTYRPDTHPWEMLGHKVKPLWWDATYSWDAGAERDALLTALKFGIVGNSSTPDVIDIRYARHNYDWDNDILVTTDGVLNGPVTANVVASPDAIDASKKFVFGDWGEVENQWRNTSEYYYALAEAYLQLSPYSTHELYWTLHDWNINTNVTEAQWVNTNYCQRRSSSEIHNQVITDGVISSIKVVNGGTDYTSLELAFDQDAVCYKNASAIAYLDNGNVTNVAVTEPGRGFDNAPNVTLTANEEGDGVVLEYNIDMQYHVTHLGFNTLPAEQYIDISSDTTALSELLEELSINYMLHVGGFTDQRILSIELDGDYADGVINVPEDSYSILLDRGAPTTSVFYSGVKIDKVEGKGYVVNGYNLDSKYFNYLTPSTAGTQTKIEIDNVSVIKHKKWRNEITRVQYGTSFHKRQDLYSFLLGLAQYYELIGFDVVTQWEIDALDVMRWAIDSTQTEPYYVNGIDESLVYAQGSTGVVQTIDVNYHGVANVIDNTFAKIKQADLLVLRNDTDTEVTLKDSSNRIYGIGLNVIEYEHIISIDNVSMFNDIFYIPEIGAGHNRVRLVGEKTRNWNGRIEAPGYLVQDTGLILNIESSVREFEHDWISSESKALERLTRQTIGFNVGYSKPTYMTDMFIGDKSAYKFEQGERKYRGTESAIEAMTRNKNIFGVEFEHNLYESWMVRLGDYGDVSERNPLQFEIDNNKIKTNPQHIRFNAAFTSDKSNDLIIDLHKGSDNAISGDFDTPFELYDVLPKDNTSIVANEPFQNFTRDAGLPIVDEIDYFLSSIDDISTIYDPIADYALIPNWSETTAYIQGEQVRRYGKVYSLLINSTGITNVNDDITIRGTQVYPTVENDTTFIANDITVTFAKTNASTSYDTITIDGTISNPVVPSGQTLTIDGVNINFINTETSVIYDDIELVGNVSFPTIQNNVTEQLVIGYANDADSALTTVTVDFNELATTESMQTIWADALDIASVTDAIGMATTHLNALETLRAAYVAATNVATWEATLDNYYDFSGTPNRLLNPEFWGEEVNANLGASWEAAARNLIQSEIDLIADLSGNAATETIASIVSGTLNDAAQFNLDLDAANTLLDYDIAVNEKNKNLLDFVLYILPNGDETIALGKQITVTYPSGYVIDDIDSIITKIENALSTASAPVDITVTNVNDTVVLSRISPSEGYRLGVATNDDLGFDATHNDVTASGTTNTGPVDLELTDIVESINNANIAGVSAQSANNVVRILSVNQILTIDQSTALTNLGINAGVTNATPNVTDVPVDLSIGDVITQINASGITDLVASQINGVLILTYTGDELIIGEGTANTTLGITSGTYESFVDDVQNEFNEDDWTQITDPAHFNIWTIDNDSTYQDSIDNNNSYDVYQTLDFEIGVTEICAGEENGDDALIKTDNEHTLGIGDYVLIVNSTCVPSVDGIHQVTSVMDTTKFFIDRYIDQKGYTGKVIPIRSVRFPDSAQAAAAIEGSLYSNGALGISNDDYVYVDLVLDDDGNSLGYGGTYKVASTENGSGIELYRAEVGKTNNTKIKNGKLYSYESGDIISTYEVFDPLKGIIPGIADYEIDFRSEYDNAKYNNSTDADVELRLDNVWGPAQVGKVWWDLSNAIYLNYDQHTPEYRQLHWGSMFPTATIDVYEWTKSPVTPDEYLSAVEAGTIIDGIELTGTPYSMVDQYGEEQFNWSEDIELNVNTNQLETYYYFWVSNKTTTPTMDRLYSVTQIAQIIEDPTAHNVSWMAATSENTLLVTDLTQNSGYDDLIMQVNFDTHKSAYHQEFLMLAENDPDLYIPEWLHISLRDSLAGFTQTVGNYQFTNWENDVEYTFESIVKSDLGKFFRCHAEHIAQNPDDDADNDYWTLLDYITENPDGDWDGGDVVSIDESKNIPDRSLHEYARYGIDTRPHQTWFVDISEARHVALTKLNDQLSEINIVDSNIPWQDVFENTIVKGEIEYNLTDYWQFIDWSYDGNVYERGIGDYFVDTESEMNLLSPNDGEIVQVCFSNDIDSRNRRQVFKFVDDEWLLIYKEKATLEFNDLLWNNDIALSGWDVVPWDTNVWDKNASAVMTELFDVFYNDIWVGDYQSLYADLWFVMVKHVFTEHREVDWIFKTSYFDVTTEDDLEKQYNKYFNQNVDELFDYINTVKPFRSKVKDVTLRKTTDDEFEMSGLDGVEIRVQVNPVDSTIDETDTRSFRLNVSKTNDSYSSQIINAHKMLLATNLGPDDTRIPFLNWGAATTMPDGPGAFWINGERIEYTAVTHIGGGNLGGGFSSGFNSGFSGITLLTGITRGTQGTFARSHKYADVIEASTGFELIENTTLSDWNSDIQPAWNDLGAGMLDGGNTDANGITIQGNGFGTIDLYGDILYAQWVVLGEPADAIDDFQSELEELIEEYWVLHS